MTKELYLKKLIGGLSATHDIVRNYPFEGLEFPVYARYSLTNERYVLTRKSNLWRAKEYEHLLAADADGCGPGLADAFGNLIREKMEPAFVLQGQKYPEKDHMRSFLTLVLLSSSPISQETAKRVKRYRFDRGYLFSFRGFCQGRIVLVDLASEKVYVSKGAEGLKTFFSRLFRP